MDRDKHDALNAQKEAMNRTFRVQLAKLAKEKEDLARKLQNQSKTNTAGASANVNVASAGAAGPQITVSAECQKLTHENAVLRGEKKKLEDQFQVKK